MTVIVFLPLLTAAVLALFPNGHRSDRAARSIWLALTLVEVVLVAVLWAGYSTPPPGQLTAGQRVEWLPGVGASYTVGVDGLSLPLIALTAVVFTACAAYAWREQHRPRAQAALFCFLQSMSLGVFAAGDLIIFFIFFDLSIVGMYFSILRWGSGQAARSALKFFLYTFLGSLIMLAGFIGLYVAAAPHTFDMAELVRQAPLNGSGWTGGAVLAAIVIGLAIKTPTVPFHTWLPPAHTDAPAVGSAVLAGVMLKMGTYGFVRIAMPMLPQAWRSWAWIILVVGIVSALYGALVALAQHNLKRMIAYTSVNHMGYVVMAVGAAGLLAGGPNGRQLAVTGAVVQMVSHGLITAALFLLAGVLHERRDSYRLDDYGGLAEPAPRLAGLLAVAAFASLGIPGFSGFIAEFQIFTGSIGIAAVTAVALLGILITAALFLRALQRMLVGPVAGRSVGFTDLRRSEITAVGLLMALSLLIGVLPRPLNDVVEPAARVVVDQVDR